MVTTAEPFRCMACGHEYEEQVEKGTDRERQCPRCRSNSIRLLKRRPAADQRPKDPAT